MEKTKGALKVILEHPFATYFLVSVTTSGIASIIRAARGTDRTTITIEQLRELINDQPTTTE